MSEQILQIRVILDTEADVFRDLEVEDTSTLEDLHLEVIKSFTLEPGEMASFYVSDEEWNQGMEIGLEAFGDGPAMKDATVGMMLQESGDRLLFVYDFLNMWTFFLELIRAKPTEPGAVYPRETLRFGERPESAPEKDFGAVESGKGRLFDDAFDEDEGDFGDQSFDDEDAYS
jgi:hypothetical protein